MSSMDLAEFLIARLDEDEQAARDAHYEGQRWISEEEGVWRWPDDEAVHTADRKRDAAHIARHDPAHVLREVAAMRAIVDEHSPARAIAIVRTGPKGTAGDDRTARCRTCAALDTHGASRFRAPCPTLRALAAIWSEHPDYRQEWKP